MTAHLGQPCVIAGGPVKLFYFPVDTIGGGLCNGSASTIVNTKPEVITTLGRELTSGSVYLSFSTLYASYDGFWDRVGPTFDDYFMTLQSSDISTRCGGLSTTWGWGRDPATQVNFADWNSPIAADVYNCQKQCSGSPACSTIWDNFNPWLAVPSIIRERIPAWSTCTFTDEMEAPLLFDPPTALAPATAIAPVTTPSAPDSTTAAPSPTPTSPLPVETGPSKTLTGGQVSETTEAAARSSLDDGDVDTNIPEPSTPDSAGTPQVDSTAPAPADPSTDSVVSHRSDDGDSGSGTRETPPQSANADPTSPAAPASAVGVQSPTATSGKESSSPGDGSSQDSDSASNPKPSSEGPLSAGGNSVGPGGSVETAQSDPFSGDQGSDEGSDPASQTHADSGQESTQEPDAPITTNALSILESAANYAMGIFQTSVESQSDAGNVLANSPTEAARPRPEQSVQTATFGSNTVQVSFASAYAQISDQTLSAGGLAQTVSGDVLSMASSNIIVDGTSTLDLEDPVAASAGSATTAEVGGKLYTISQAGDGAVVVNGVTASQGGSNVHVGDHVVSAGVFGVVVGSSTPDLVEPTAEAAGLATTADVGGKIYTVSRVGGGDWVVNGISATQGGQAVQVGGQMVSAAGSGLLVGSSTLQIAPLQTTLKQEDAVSIAGTTLSVGGSAMIAGGKTLSLASSGLAVLRDGRTEGLAPASDAADGHAVYTLNVLTLTADAVAGLPADSQAMSIAGTTLSVGGSAMVLGDETLTLASSGLILVQDGQTEALIATSGSLSGAAVYTMGSLTLTAAAVAASATAAGNVGSDTGTQVVFGSQTYNVVPDQNTPALEVIDGSITASVGGPAKTVDGHVFSAATSGIVVEVEASTVSLPAFASTTSMAANGASGDGAETATGSMAQSTSTQSAGAPLIQIDWRVAFGALVAACYCVQGWEPWTR